MDSASSFRNVCEGTAGHLLEDLDWYPDGLRRIASSAPRVAQDLDGLVVNYRDVLGHSEWWHRARNETRIVFEHPEPCNLEFAALHVDQTRKLSNVDYPIGLHDPKPHLGRLQRVVAHLAAFACE
jgi:hypothetical protein